MGIRCKSIPFINTIDILQKRIKIILLAISASNKIIMKHIN